MATFEVSWDHFLVAPALTEDWMSHISENIKLTPPSFKAPFTSPVPKPGHKMSITRKSHRKSAEVSPTKRFSIPLTQCYNVGILWHSIVTRHDLWCYQDSILFPSHVDIPARKVHLLIVIVTEQPLKEWVLVVYVREFEINCVLGKDHVQYHPTRSYRTPGNNGTADNY